MFLELIPSTPYVVHSKPPETETDPMGTEILKGSAVEVQRDTESDLKYTRSGNKIMVPKRMYL